MTNLSDNRHVLIQDPKGKKTMPVQEYVAHEWTKLGWKIVKTSDEMQTEAAALEAKKAEASSVGGPTKAEDGDQKI